MKRIIYITILAFLFLAGCTKPSAAPAPTPEQYDRYIFFSHSVETKATLVEKATDMNGKDFGVVGFKYDENTDWATFSTTKVNGNLPKPNVFYDDDNTTLVDVETVGVDGTTANYSPLQGWSNNKKYAFFAFYPHNMELVNLDDDTPYSGGVPAIKYTMTAPTASTEGVPADGTAFKASMFDVITADHINQYWKSSTENSFINKQSDDFVLEFSHRLSSLEVIMKNSSSGTIKINSLVLTISGIKNVSTIIPLDGNTLIPTALEEPMTATFTINLEEDEKAIGADPTRIKDKLIFIPQDENISITMSIEYTDPYSESSVEKVITDLKTPLAEGCKHMLQLNFLDYNVYVMVVNEWETAPDVNHDFS